MPDTRTLREQIKAIIDQGNSWEQDNQEIRILAERWADQHSEEPGRATVHSTVTVNLARDGADQGITRLALIAFVAGEESTQWNGSRVNGSGWPGTAWVRYRGHNIDREVTPDGVTIRVAARDHEGGERIATFAGANAEHGMSTNLLAVDDIDQLLDIVIEQHGVPDEGVVVATPVSQDDARRVLDTFAEWTRARPWPIDNPVDTFIADVKDGTVVL